MDKVCRTCENYDPNYHGGYCNREHKDTSSSGYCSWWK